MDERAEGIVVRLLPLTDTSWVVRWLTREQGRISCVAKGARRPKSPFLGKLDLYYRTELSFQRSRRSDLHTLKEVVVLEDHRELRKDVGWLQQAAYANASLELATEPETPVTELYELFREFLLALPSASARVISVVAWELKLLACCGMEPVLSQAPVRKEAVRVAEELLTAQWREVVNLSVGGGIPEELARWLERPMRDSFGRLARQREGALHGWVG